MNYFYLMFPKIWRSLRLAAYRRITQKANTLECVYEPLNDQALSEKQIDLHEKAQTLRDIHPLLPDALALCREVVRRTLGLRLYDVQLMGTLALYEGHIAEMNTGEGKTLMAPLAAYLHQLGHIDRCTHIVTANEYLAARDAQWMKPVLDGLGMTVGVIVPGQSNPDRIRAYQNKVVYATAREIVFDSLREPIRQKKIGSVDAILRPRHELVLDPIYDFAIVDEVDSVLIDQARSPLSIGGESSVSGQIDLYRQAHAVAGQLVRGRHYRIMHDDRMVEMKEEGKAEAQQLAGKALRLLPPGQKWQRYVTCALAARHIYKRDQHYVLKNNRVILIDESTGRLMPGRQLPDGIHQAIEVMNGLAPTAELRGNYMTTFQTFFRKYNKLAGMTGTASMAAYEFLKVYGLAAVQIPSNRPSQRKFHEDRVFRHLKFKYESMVDHIEQIHTTGRPILIGTGSIQISEHLSEMLNRRGLEHEVLNAKNHAREAEIIAQAGQQGRITIITNMAGRGVDIKLGPGIAEKGGMCLFSTDRLHYRRLDEQLTGRVGRQGDPADCMFYLSLKDDLMRYADKKQLTRLRQATRSARGEIIRNPQAEKLFRNIQKRIDKSARKQRQQIYRSEKHREKLKADGLWEDWMDLR